MRPSFPIRDQANASGGNSIAFSDVFHPFTKRHTDSYCRYNFRIYFGLWKLNAAANPFWILAEKMILATRRIMSSFCCRILRVRGICPEEKMIWVAALSVIAFVQHEGGSLWYVSEVNQVKEPVGFNLAPPKVESTIAASPYPACPLPASPEPLSDGRPVFVHLGPKASGFFWGEIDTLKMSGQLLFSFDHSYDMVEVSAGQSLQRLASAIHFSGGAA
jgi:hypothetical protein